MHRLIVSNLVSLDGFIAGPADETDWFRADEEFLSLSHTLCRSVAALLLGRRTYELMAAYWPTPQAFDTTPDIAERLNHLPKAVVSRTLTRTPWGPCQRLAAPDRAAIESLKRVAGGDIAVFGSGTLVATLLEQDLVDELRLYQHPVLLGAGRTQLGIGRPRDWLLRQSLALRSGVVMLHYTRATRH